MPFPRGATHCDGPSCCLQRKEGQGVEVPRPASDQQGEVRWFCSEDCRRERMKQ